MITYKRGQLTFRAVTLGEENTETIILLHGFPSDAESWLPVAELLVKDGYRVVIPEQRGYSSGARPRALRAYKLSELAEDTQGLVAAIGTERVHVVGHDWGGAVAWSFASKYPELVSSLIVVSAAHPRAFLASLWRSRQLLLSWYMILFQLPLLPEWILMRKQGTALIKLLVTSGLNRSSALRYAKYMQQRSLLTAALNWYRGMRFGRLDGGYTEAIKSRTLFICGGKDNFTSHSSIRLTGKWVSGPYQLMYLPDETHWIPEESPEMLARSIHEFIIR